MTQPTLRPARPDNVDATRARVDAAYQLCIPRIGRAPGPLLDDYEARVANVCQTCLKESR